MVCAVLATNPSIHDLGAVIGLGSVISLMAIKFSW